MKTSTKTLVTISIVLNVLFIGFFLGSITKDCKHKMHPKKKFSPEIMEKLGSIKEEAHEHMDEMKGTREKIMATLTAEVFDPVAFENASAELHQCRGEMMCSMTDKIKEMAMTMSHEDRIEFAAALKQQFRSKHKERRHH